MIMRSIVTALLLAIAFCGSAQGSTALERARPYFETLERALDSTWPTMSRPEILGGQVEQESSWKATATLKTPREHGRGLVQMTVAYHKDGRERFNIYRSAVRYRQLKEWNWQKDPYNASYQLTFLTLQDKGNYDQVRPYFKNDTEAFKGMLVCYNAGPGRWLRRLKNARAMGLPTDVWDGGLDRAYSQGEAALLYGRPLYEAVNEYPRVVFKRAAKYQGQIRPGRN